MCHSDRVSFGVIQTTVEHRAHVYLLPKRYLDNAHVQMKGERRVRPRQQEAGSAMSRDKCLMFRDGALRRQVVFSEGKWQFFEDFLL